MLGHISQSVSSHVWSEEAWRQYGCNYISTSSASVSRELLPNDAVQSKKTRLSQFSDTVVKSARNADMVCKQQ